MISRIIKLKTSIPYCAILIGLVCSIWSNSVVAQEKWKLADDDGWLKIYTRPMINSKIKSIKVECTLEASASQLVAAIVDIKTCGEWVYSSKKNIMIKQISPLDLIYYSEVTVPWPVENRDYVVHIMVEQDPKTKAITINSPCIPGYVEEKPNIVRISKSVAKWTIVPMEKNQLRVEYLLEVDPLGSIPPWLINLFATKGPSETFKKLRTHVKKDIYKKTSYPSIVN
ncbi:START domain-containing protein [Pedobacter sp. AW31-3R]|uniref:START domain-containing protein n=1 Tax=Pedobacter sp. AW31-3R TaxID=3445781 RepID=UPI003FA12620